MARKIMRDNPVAQAKNKSKGKRPAVAKATTQKLPPKLGRPTKFNQALADQICAELSIGRSLRTVCSPDSMPHISTIFNWFRSQPSFLEQYTRAKQEAADSLVDEMLDIADEGTNDYMTIVKGDKEYEVVNNEAIQRSRLRVETRKWIAAKLKPKAYGDKIDVTSGGEKLPTPLLGGLSTQHQEALKEEDTTTDANV